MSRSFKKQPFDYICCGRATKDRRRSNRGTRRTQNRYIRNHFSDEEFLLPHPLECPWNEKYSWDSDGDKSWRGLDGRDWGIWVEANFQPWNIWYGDERRSCWPPSWYVEMMRK